MLDVVRSELTRLTRKGVVWGWLGLMALFAVLINTIMFKVAANGTAPAAGGPGVALPTAAALAQPAGLVAGLGAASNLFGVVCLSFWAVVTAADYQSGLIRLLATAQPTRWKLVAGKAIALAIGTAVATTAAVIIGLPSAAPSARAAGISTAAWSEHAAAHVASAWLNTFLALLVWGAIGLVLATVSRSSAIAISVGVGYVLVVETLIKSGASAAGKWLPGTTLTALAQGGSPALSYLAALLLGAGYLAVALGVAALVMTRRPITS